MTKEFEYVLLVVVNAFKAKFPSIIPNNDSIAVEFTRKYNPFKTWALEREIIFGESLDTAKLGMLLVDWIKEQEPGITHDQIFVRFGILVIEDAIRDWETLRPADLTKSLDQKQIRMAYPGFEGQRTAAIWFFEQLNNQELEYLGIRRDLVQRYRKQLAEMRYLDFRNASYYMKRQIELISQLMEIKFDFTKFPHFLRNKLIYYSQMDTPGAVQSYGEIFGIPEQQRESVYRNKVMRDVTVLSAFGDMIKQAQIDPQAAADAFAIRPESKRFFAILGYLWTIRGVYEDSLSVAKAGRVSGVTAASVDVFFSSELFGNGFLYDVVSQPSWEKYAKILTVLGVAETAFVLKERFVHEEALNLGITKELLGIKDAAMAIQREGGINLNPQNMLLNVQQQGKAVQIAAVDSAMIDGLRPNVLKVTPLASIWPLLDLPSRP